MAADPCPVRVRNHYAASHVWGNHLQKLVLVDGVRAIPQVRATYPSEQNQRVADDTSPRVRGSHKVSGFRT